MEKHRHLPNETPLPNKKQYANNTYLANGTVRYKRCDNVKDKLYPAKQSKFKIQFKDAVDSIGIPTLKVESFELK